MQGDAGFRNHSRFEETTETFGGLIATVKN